MECSALPLGIRLEGRKPQTDKLRLVLFVENHLDTEKARRQDR